MIKNEYYDKYKKRYNNENHIYIDDDDNTLLNKNRPLNLFLLKSFSKNNMEEFIDDMLNNKKINHLIYRTNLHIAKDENKFNKKKKEVEITADAIFKKKEKLNVIENIQKTISNFKFQRKEKINYLKEKNLNFYKHQNNSLQEQIEKYYEPVNKIRKKSFERILKKCSSNLDIKKNFKLPNVKLNINNVFSRLYHNKVLIYEPEKENNNEEKILKKNTIKSFSQKQLETINQTQTSTFLKHNKSIPNLTIKNTLKNLKGKEFIKKLNENDYKTCFFKNSGGPKKIIKISSNFHTKCNSKKELNPKLLNLENNKDKYGNNELQRAVINNKKQLIKYFIDKGIDPNEKNDKGNTAMHLAMLNDDEDTIQMILDAGGNLYIKNNDDDTPIDLASKYILKKYESIIN